MLTKKYEELTPYEKAKFIGELVHCVQTLEPAFDEALDIIRVSRVCGIFDKVTIMPENKQVNS